jgi:hypothetical protein
MWIDNVPIEHTTFRRESGYDGVHASCVEPSTLKEDAFRRDLTINSMYMLWGTKEVVDPVGGMLDLRTKSLRLVSSKDYGDEYQRLHEHGGRLFRLARFACKFRGWTINPNTLAACSKFAPDAFIRGKRESFGEEWVKASYCKEYLLMLDTMRFLEHHSISPPNSVDWYPKYPWYSLWVYANKPPIKEFSNSWKLSKDTVLEITDLTVGKAIQNEWQWRTTKFRRLSAEEVAKFWGKSFRLLPIPTQSEVALQIEPGPHVQQVWKEQVVKIYHQQ